MQEEVEPPHDITEIPTPIYSNAAIVNMEEQIMFVFMDSVYSHKVLFIGFLTVPGWSTDFTQDTNYT